MKKINLTFIIILVLSLSSNAQILNFNKGLLQSDTVKWLGKIEVFFDAIDQEVSIANMGYDLDVIRKFDNTSIMAISKLSFATSNGDVLLSDGYAHVRGVINRRKKLSEEIFGQIQYNAIRGLEDRFLIGGGLRYLVVDKDKYGILAGMGLIYEWENWIYEEAISSTSILKSSNYISFYGDVNKQFHFNVISYYQASFESLFVPRVSLEVNLNLNITKRLSFTSSFNMYYDKKPVIPIDNFVFKFQNGLGYQF